MKRPRRQAIEIDVGELHAVLERARQEPISEADYRKMKVAIDVLAERLTRTRTTEKTRAVVEQRPLSTTESAASGSERRAGKGHGRHGAGAFTGAQKVVIRHANLTSGDRCPDCARGRVYTQQKPKTLVRIVGQAPVEATVYEMERLRCNACGTDVHGGRAAWDRRG